MWKETATGMGKISVLLVEDSPGDARLILEAFKESKIDTEVKIVEDGVEAIAFLKREGVYAHEARPDLILLDLNLPRKDGREVLAEIKNDDDFKQIPVLVLTTSNQTQDILTSYERHANSFITKPIDMDTFFETMKSLEDFWFHVVKLPPREEDDGHDSKES